MRVELNLNIFFVVISVISSAHPSPKNALYVVCLHFQEECLFNATELAKVLEIYEYVCYNWQLEERQAAASAGKTLTIQPFACYYSFIYKVKIT